jgi:rifampicin phosphotransferase
VNGGSGRSPHGGTEESPKGIGAAPGTARGQAAILRPGREQQTIPSGSILVARIVHPHLAPLFLTIRAVVVEEGALLQHATTLAREFGIPAVVGLEGATHRFAEGQWLEVRGDTGEVVPLRRDTQ